MKHSIRTRITAGVIFLFTIILVLAIFSGYYLDQLSGKTGAILKENYISVIYARDMTEGLMFVNHELTDSYLKKRAADTSKLGQYLRSIEESLGDEQNNITEPGEDRLVRDIGSMYREYRDSVKQIAGLTPSQSQMIFTRDRSEDLINMLLLLSRMNGTALEKKTDDAKASSKNALKNMTILATICFLVGMTFAYSLVSYINQRILQLHDGIRQVVDSNFARRLYFDGKDEFYEISQVFNEMVDKLEEGGQKLSVTLPVTPGDATVLREIKEMKAVLLKLKELERKAEKLISGLEKNK